MPRSVPGSLPRPAGKALRESFMSLDRRLHAFRDDLADKALEGRVKAARLSKASPHGLVFRSRPCALGRMRRAASTPNCSSARTSPSLSVPAAGLGSRRSPMVTGHYLPESTVSGANQPTHHVIVPAAEPSSIPGRTCGFLALRRCRWAAGLRWSARPRPAALRYLLLADGRAVSRSTALRSGTMPVTTMWRSRPVLWRPLSLGRTLRLRH